MTKKSSPIDDGRRRIQSIETGHTLLAALVETGTPMTLRDLAHAAGMSPAKAHPYLVSFINVGLVRQDSSTTQYELGPFALQMGIVSLHRLSPIRIALPLVNELATQIGHTLAVAVLGSHGPTMVHITEASYPVHVNMRPGTVMSMMHTATGHVFAAWLAPKVAEHYIQREYGDKAVVTSMSQPDPKPTVWTQKLEQVREQGMAKALGNPLPGIDALSVPVFDHTASLVLAITSLGPSSLFDASTNGPIARALSQCARNVSTQLGFKS